MPQQLPETHSVTTMHEQWPLHGDNAYQRRFQAAASSRQPKSGSSILVHFKII